MTPTDQVASKLLEIINQIQTGVVAHTPDAMNMLLATVQVNCAQNFTVAVVCALFMLIFTKILLRIKARIKADKESKKEPYERLDWDDPGVLIAAILSGFGIIIATVFFLVGILDIWSWVGLFNPKLYLAHEIIQKVMQ